MSRSLKPRPPVDFDLPNFSQLIQCIFDFFDICPHQKDCIILFRSLHKVTGSKNTRIQYVGIACTTALIKISFPAWERNFTFQFVNLFQTLSLMLLKAWILDLPIRDGSPR
jgi:hypothetical protein